MRIWCLVYHAFDRILSIRELKKTCNKMMYFHRLKIKINKYNYLRKTTQQNTTDLGMWYTTDINIAKVNCAENIADFVGKG